MNLSPSDLLRVWLNKRLSDEDRAWLSSRLSLVTQSNSERDLHITLGMIPRKLGRYDLAPDHAELADAQLAHTGWDPSQWSIDTAARVLVMCTLAARDSSAFPVIVKDLCQSADLAESIALYIGCPLYPHSAALDQQIGEGLRTSIRAVFEAIAHRNPYPRQHFSEHRWNHMVLKALFIDSTLAPIQGLDERTNPELATILCNYAHERWAAHRPVTPELWRCVGPHATGSMLDDLIRVTQSGSTIERDAALLALSSCSEPAATAVLNKFTAVGAAIDSGELTWNSLDAHTKGA